MKRDKILVLLILIVIGAYLLINPQAIGLSENSMSLDGQTRAEIWVADGENIENAVFSGNVGVGGRQIAYGCVLYQGGGVTYTCKQAGYKDTVAALGQDGYCSYGSNHPFGSEVKCYKYNDVPINSVEIKIANQIVWSCSSNCANQQFETADISSVINSYPECVEAFNNEYNCRVNSVCTGSRNCYVPIKGTADVSDVYIENLNLDATEGQLCSNEPTCSGWGSCIDGLQTRTCILPCSETTFDETQSCSTSESCFDGIKNQDEEGVDCGGVCQECDPGDGSDTKTPKPLYYALIMLGIILLTLIVWMVRKR